MTNVVNADISKAVLIGVDWGTSTLRAYLIDAGGNVLEHLQAPKGIMQVPNKDFETVLTRLIEPWCLAKKLPVIASGMITSRNGWLETPYLPVPVSASQLAGTLKHWQTARGLDIHFVTGLVDRHEVASDVMRGEETQIVGAVQAGISDGVFVLPGSHSKWVTVENGIIKNFSTYMTGELYAVLCQHTILGMLMKDAEFNADGFGLGVKSGFESGSKLLNTLFHVRTLPLFEQLDENAVDDYLSGMLIGAEISGATGIDFAGSTVALIGQDSLSDRYAMALDVLDMNSIRTPDDLVTRGHFSIAKYAGLLL